MAINSSGMAIDSRGVAAAFFSFCRRLKYTATMIVDMTTTETIRMVSVTSMDWLLGTGGAIVIVVVGGCVLRWVGLGG